MIKDGPRRQGRFIKSGSKVMDKVSLVDFSFDELNDAKVITPDNAKRTIIHSSFHAAEELNDAVVGPPKFNEDLSTRDSMRPVIFPTDFTKEWERDKKLRKDRVARQDDDDFDYDLEATRQKEEEERLAAIIAAEEEEEREKAKQQNQRQPGAKQNPAAPVTPAAAAKQATPAGGQWQSMDVVGKAIKGLMTEGEDDGLPGAPIQQAPAAPAPAPAPKTTDSFIPVGSAPTGAGAPIDPEAVAAEEYRQRVETLKANEAKLAELAEEAKAQGYRDGFRMGEEKAELQARQNASQLFGKVSELIHEFAGLKHEILNNVQENFYELCQAMAESLIKREFSLHPDTFVAVLRRAIDEAVEPGKFKIRVHPETFERIAGLGSSEILESLVRDKDIQAGDFKIESQLSVVDVSVTKMISELLQQADLSLFQQDQDQEQDQEVVRKDKAS